MGANNTSIRIFDLVLYIDGPMDVPFADWPANLQDAVLAALVAKSVAEELPLKIVHAEYKKDPDYEDGHPHRHYAHVVASEIVMADERTIDPKRIVQELPDDIKRLLN